jgi:hypothetical protein
MTYFPGPSLDPFRGVDVTPEFLTSASYHPSARDIMAMLEAAL